MIRILINKMLIVFIINMQLLLLFYYIYLKKINYIKPWAKKKKNNKIWKIGGSKNLPFLKNGSCVWKVLGASDLLYGNINY